MCLVTSNIEKLSRWNWEGDEIIHKCIVPSSRYVVGASTRKKYDIDVREFLITERNEIMRKTIKEDIKSYIQSKGGDWNLFQERTSGAFDYRANIIRTYVSETIKYAGKGGSDPWQFPDETLFLKSGDCEDRAFLIASLLIASGISSYNVRVALGRVKTSDNDSYDHMWVMYKNEKGHWMLIEPLIVRRGRERADMSGREYRRSKTMAQYIPSYLFNDAHLWIVKHNEKQRQFQAMIGRNWKKFNPKFAGEVHQTILNMALKGADESIIQRLNGYFHKAVLKTIGPIVDDIDRRTYDPLDHFDNGYIKEGWEQINNRLKSFKTNNEKNLDDFALAAHAIADFYAHTTYVHFSKIIKSEKGGYAQLYDPQNPIAGLRTTPDYSSGSTFELTGNDFSINSFFWAETDKAKIPDVWKGKIISGRYAQEKDSQGDIVKSVIEACNKIPDRFLKAKDFYKKGSLPHHNEIAVDQERIDKNHRLYKRDSADERIVFKNQFLWRRNAAVLHVRKAFYENRDPKRISLNWKMPPTLAETGS
ncbi:MAG: transglutaminase domain-containing protein [Nitrospirae bacterium]|nr:MAG: transglutaminase domain-containing protein [Nitrospirota bacterium]